MVLNSVRFLCWVFYIQSLGWCQEVENIPHPKHSPQEPLKPLELIENEEPIIMGKVDGVEELVINKQFVKPDGLQSVNHLQEVDDKIEVPPKPIEEPEIPTVVVPSDREEPELAEETPQPEFKANLPTEDATEEPDEAIPSFKEFRERKEKEESEKGKSKAQTDRQKSVNEEEVESEDEKPKPKGKLIQKNYADTVCGAKIADNKKDFKNAASVLNKDKDSYAMIPCEGPIWFVVELCDTIQITAIQLANFELFASSIHEFKVYTSEAYPPKEWTHIGTFAARNKREMEKFEISGHGQYGKYVKFEKISHRGKEHFCVLTAFQVLGMSMVDEYEEQQAQPETIDPYELPIDSFDGTEPSEVAGGDKSLIVGAKNAVKNIVDSALGVLGVTNKEGEEEVDLPTAEPPPIPTPLPDPVVVKVDERGKEIKVVEEKKPEGEEKRLKGEEGSEVKKQPTVVIMEGVNLAEEKKADDTVIAPAAAVVVEPASTKEDPDIVAPPVAPAEKGETLPVPVVESKEEPKEEAKKETPKKETPKKETPPKVEQKEEVVNKPAADVPQQQPAVPVEAKDSKGVVMTNSPKKNSIFLELDKRIKELERNLSLSNDYLETLSSRYKKVDNLFKPLEKTLATVDEAMKQFEDRLGQIEARFESIQGMLADIQERASDIGGKSNSLITTTNLILFILLLAFYFIWRMSKKVNEISGVFEERRAARIARPMSPTAGAVCGGNEENRKQKKTRQVRSKSRDTSPMPPTHGPIRGARSETQINRRISATDAKKTPLESLQMDLIYPQPKVSQLKNRKTKHHIR